MDFFGSELLSDKAQISDFKNASSHRSSSTSCYKRDSVSLSGCCLIPNFSIFTAPSPPSCATTLHPADEVCPNFAARTLRKLRSVERDADISPSTSSIWARPKSFSKVDSPVPPSKTFSMRRVVPPATKQMKLSKSLTVLLSCGAVCTGPEDATDFVSTIFRGVIVYQRHDSK
ncbi:uncharacterized protein LOC130505699 isoform X2 [Raphanus sativus]|uniref:Uncharacterized protein LOC130505699 isoform X2 n=1 Tax=Raphanus sativus TaxID=3726 RepID=A0A9W3CXH5_RAPSA|nr:uncharacterized protein LOC130505699 isoform X2 [Raphanus sativus]